MVQYAKADVLPLIKLQDVLQRKLTTLVGDQYLAWQLVQTGSLIHGSEFSELQDCRCRLCCNASENARFNGHRFFTNIAPHLHAILMQKLWRSEDAYPMQRPGPSKFYVNEMDE